MTGSRAFTILQTVLLLGLTAVVIFLLIERNDKKSVSPPVASGNAPSPAPALQSPKQEQAKQQQPISAPVAPPSVSEPVLERTIVDDTVAVAPRSYYQVPFTVSRVSAVEGRFEAQGGRGNDISVFITDEDGFTNFKNGHQFNGYYGSGKVTVGEIKTTVPAGTFYVILSNQHSLISNKVVHLTIHTK